MTRQRNKSIDSTEKYMGTICNYANITIQHVFFLLYLCYIYVWLYDLIPVKFGVDHKERRFSHRKCNMSSCLVLHFSRDWVVRAATSTHNHSYNKFETEKQALRLHLHLHCRNLQNHGNGLSWKKYKGSNIHLYSAYQRN